MRHIALECIVAIIGGGVVHGVMLKDASDYAVKRDLLERRYPAYKSFRGLMHSGLMPAATMDDQSSGHDDPSSYFFVLLRPDADASDDAAEGRKDETFRNDTLLIWLNGGPGCSSMTGLMAEMGPVGTPTFGAGVPSPNPAPLVKNKYAWTRKSAMLFVEQPGGVGFSTASKEWTGEKADERTENDVASSFYAFLQNIYAVFGDDLAKKELYISGESYAGMYIPSIAREIHLQNKRISDSLATPSVVDDSVIHKARDGGTQISRIIPIRGLAIGNGWIDAKIQGPTTIDFACMQRKIQGPTTIDFAWWHGMIDLQDHRNLHIKWNECMNMQILDSSEKPFHPFTVPDECGITSAVMKASGSKFMYDVTSSDAYPAILDEGGALSSFFNDPVVRTSFNAPSMEEQPHWSGCVPGAGRRRLMEEMPKRNLTVLDNDRPLSVVPYIAELLDDAKLSILLYNGDLDLACSPQSTELALDSMEWSGAKGWKDQDISKWKKWTVDGQPAGHTKKFSNLQFLVVYNSGHFVPINQPQRSLNMIGRLLDGKTLGDKSLPIFETIDQTTIVQNENLDVQQCKGTSGTRSFSFLAGLSCFALGLLVSYFVIAPRSAHLKQRQSSTHSSMLQLVTEATPLFDN